MGTDRFTHRNERRARLPEKPRGRRASSETSPTRGSSSHPAPTTPGSFSGKTQKLIIAFGIILLAVVVRLFWLQIFDGPALASDAKENRTNTFVIHAKRGTIYDRNGNVLAASVECKTLYANPHEIKEPQKVADILAANLGGKADDFMPSLTKDTTFVYIKKKVDEDAAKKTMAALDDADINGIYSLSDMKRIYPYGATAGQVLGIVGTDGEGLTGLELQYNDVLGGKNGERVMETGLYGTPIAGGAYEEIPAKNGTDIMISLDINIQQITEATIAKGVVDYKAQSGQATVMQPKTGEILAMCSTPFLDPNNTQDAKTEAFTLNPITGSYEPGSVMKTLVASLGIEKKKFTPDTNYLVPPAIKVGDDTVKDSIPRAGSMNMTVRTILERSSNIGAVLMSRDIGAQALENGYASLGIGHLTGIDYPGEAEGMVPDPATATSTNAEANSFGQALAIPSIQTVRAIGTIANGGVLETPHFLLYKGTEKVDWPSGPQIFSEETAKQVTDLMINVATNGSAKKAQVPGYQIAAKTGTAEQAQNGKYLKNRYFSSLIGFAPADDPQILILTGYQGIPNFGESTAAPSFAAIMKEALLDMNIGTN